MMRSHRQLATAVALALLGAGAPAATITVNSNDDSATSTMCNLRDAVQSINSGAAVATCTSAAAGTFGTNDTIVFAPALVGSTISLQQGAVSILVPVAIVGSNQTIDAHSASRVLQVGSNTASPAFSASNLNLLNGTAPGCGSDVYQVAGDATLTSITLSGGTNTGSGRNGGGAVALIGGTLNLVNSTITGNSSSLQTGGVVVIGSGTVAVLTNSTVSGNTVNCSSNYCAGAMYVASYGTVLLDGSTLSGNTATGPTYHYVGGAIYGISDAITLINSTIVGNNATGREEVAGGIIHNNGIGATSTSGLILTNTTLSANTATASYSSAQRVSGGLLVGEYNSGKLTAANTIISGNSASGNGSPIKDLDVGGATTLSVRFSLLGTALNTTPYNAPANSNLFSDTPGLAPLANNGGTTQTRALIAGSPALSVGSVALAQYNGTPLHFDQRGVGYERTLDGTVDIGAFESSRGDRIFADGFEAPP